jgi:hypothetical protein
MLDESSYNFGQAIEFHNTSVQAPQSLSVMALQPEGMQTRTWSESLSVLEDLVLY